MNAATERYAVIGYRTDDDGTTYALACAGPYRTFRKAEGDAVAWTHSGRQFVVVPMAKAGVAP